jgi:GNAT superfamily N-acetyltransferase
MAAVTLQGALLPSAVVTDDLQRRVRTVPFDDPQVGALIGQLRDELDERYADLGVAAFPSAPPDPSEFLPPSGVYVLVEDGDGTPISCGGVRRRADGTGEIKRMFVTAPARGTGAGQAVLAALEEAARAAGYPFLRVETGVRQPDAISLYERAGYRPIPCFGEFEGKALSVCFEKTL